MITTSKDKSAILKTNGYCLHFCFDFSKRTGKNLVNTEIKFVTNPDLMQKVSVKSEKFLMRCEHLINLLDYFKSHIKTLETNQDYESHTFLDYNLTYQIQASSGFVSSNKDVSYFSIRSMVNIGKTSTSNFLTYIGGESTTTFSQVEKFIESLENIVRLQYI